MEDEPRGGLLSGAAVVPPPAEGPDAFPGASTQTPAIGPWQLALRRFRRNRLALAFLGLLVILVGLCLLAPVYSHDIAHIGPNTTNVVGTIKVNGKVTNVVSVTGLPIGPTFSSHYFFGADEEGRDLAVRLLYGGRTSLLIGALATTIIIVFGTLLGLLTGYFRGAVDAVLRPLMDLIWSFPPVKPIRGEVLRLREQDYVDAARVQGMGPWRIMISEILPNAASTIIVFIPMMLAITILLEAYLSFLGAGVQPPNASWGTLISDGINYIDTAPHLALIPGGMLVLTVLSINVVGDGIRDALDPRSQVRIKT